MPLTIERMPNAYRLRILIGENDKHDGKLLYEWIVIQARQQELAGATALRGLMGFGGDSRVIHTFKIERLSEDLPVVIELVDAQAKLESFLAHIEPLLRGGLATLEPVEAHFYRSH